jgi:hypothetical protein
MFLFYPFRHAAFAFLTVESRITGSYKTSIALITVENLSELIVFVHSTYRAEISGEILFTIYASSGFWLLSPTSGAFHIFHLKLIQSVSFFVDYFFT